MEASRPRVSVLMPTYDQEVFLPRSIQSLLAQTFEDWELVLVDDGSPGDVGAAIAPFLADERIRCHRLDENMGLGAALNAALDLARGDLIAYMPSDDVYYAEHLASLVAALDAQPDAVLAFSGVRHHYNRFAEGVIEGYPLQLVQVMHRRTDDRWVTRQELVTDDLGRMLWDRLEAHGAFVGTGQVTCEWVNHPAQLHKVLKEPEGGLNTYRARFQVKHPLRFHTRGGNLIDEVEHYRRFRERPDTPPGPDGLRILLVGELAYNAERVLVLEERGHQLYGLWMRDPHWYNAVGPSPFGHVTDLPRAGWQDAVRALQPDVIYALLNWQAVPFAHEVLVNNPGVPFVWHFKEGPFICLERGTWPQLVDLYTRSDGQIYISPEMRDWFATFLPPGTDFDHALVMDADLPKREWFDGERAPRLSETQGDIHTVVPGRPIGLHPHVMEEMARERIHLHFYGDYTHSQWLEWIDEVNRRAPGFLHLHANVDQRHWVAEFSQYDAGWLHVFPSRNGGEIRRANWDDLNYPARLATLAAAGLPMLQADNTGHVAATQALIEGKDIGICFASVAELGAALRDETRMARLRDNVWRTRDFFTFDAHADTLIAYFRDVIARRGTGR